MTTSHITNSHRESTGSHFLPGSAYAVLGLLSFGAELSGYELRQLALNSLRFFYWTPAQSQIYRELRRLQHREKLQGAEAAQGTGGTVGSYAPPRSAGRYRGAGVGPSPAYSYSAAVAEVAVDPESGIVTVPRVWIAHDIGQCINPAAVMGQVEGSVYMGLGEALMEEMAYRENRNVVHKIPSLLEYKSPTTLEMCDVVTYLIEDPDPNGPFGAKEVGQGPLLPVPPAVANAVYDAVGVRVDEIPITPENVLRAIKRSGKGEAGRVGPDAFPDIPWPEPIRVPPPWEGGDGKAVSGEPKPHTAMRTRRGD